MGQLHTNSGINRNRQGNLFIRSKEAFLELSVVQKTGYILALAALLGGGVYGILRAVAGGVQGAASSFAATSLTLPQGSDTTYGISDAVFKKVGAQLDNPQQIFDKVGYKPLWTAASKVDVASRLPKALTTIPKEPRVWEPWFRKHLTVNGNQLSTADMLKVKWTVIQTVANDPACQRSAGQSDAEIFNGIEAARINALKSLGLDDTNPVIFQISRLDAAFARTKSQHGYQSKPTPALADIEDRQKRYPVLSELNAADNLSCARSGLEMIYIVRGMEKIKASGVKVGASFVFKFPSQDSNKITLHSIVGAEITLPGNQKARLYYDPTPVKPSFAQKNLSLISRDAGPLDRTSLERLANVFCIAALEKQSDAWEKDGVDLVVYNYVLAENWPQFAIGNYDYKATLGGIGGHLSMKKGVEPFTEYRNQNISNISSLDRALNQVFSGQF